MRLLIIEDDHLQAQGTRQRLMARQPAWGIQRIATESEFRSKFASIADAPPSLVIIDIMLTWAWADRIMPETPPEWDGTERAGLRCAKMLSDDPRTARVPIIFYSLLDEDDFGDALSEFPHAVYVRKEPSPDGLLEAIAKATRR